MAHEVMPPPPPPRGARALLLSILTSVFSLVNAVLVWLLRQQQPPPASPKASLLPPPPTQPPPSSDPAPPATNRTAVPVAMLHEFKEIARCTSVEGIFARVRAAMLRLLPVERATVLLVDEGAAELRVIMSSDANSITVPLDQGIAGFVVSSRQTCVVSDAYADPRFDRSVDERTGYSTKNILCVPIFNHDETRVVAVLQALNKDDGRTPFAESDVVLLEVLAAHCSGLVARTSLYENGKLEQCRAEAMLMCSNALHSDQDARSKALGVLHALEIGAESERGARQPALPRHEPSHATRWHRRRQRS